VLADIDRLHAAAVDVVEEELDLIAPSRHSAKTNPYCAINTKAELILFYVFGAWPDALVPVNSVVINMNPLCKIFILFWWHVHVRQAVEATLRRVPGAPPGEHLQVRAHARRVQSVGDCCQQQWRDDCKVLQSIVTMKVAFLFDIRTRADPVGSGRLGSKC